MKDPPHINQHACHSAVFHRWRKLLSTRRALLRLSPCPGRLHASLAIMSRCMVLESLMVSQCALMNVVWAGTLEYLPCASTLSTLWITDPREWDSPYCADRLLAFLPDLEMLGPKSEYRDLFWDSGAILRHGVRELRIECTARMRPVIWTDVFTQLRYISYYLMEFTTAADPMRC